MSSSQTLTNKMNDVKPWFDVPKCVRKSSPHLSPNNATGRHARWWEGWGQGGVPLPIPPKIDPVSHVLHVTTHCQVATQSCNLSRYPQSKFLIQARRDPSKFRSNPIKLANSVTHCRRVWTLIEHAHALHSLFGTLSLTVVVYCSVLLADCMN